MSTDEARVAVAGFSCNGDNTEQDDWKDGPPTSTYLRGRAKRQFAVLLELVEDRRRTSYEQFELPLIVEVFRLGRLLLTLFLSLWRERMPAPALQRRGKEDYRRQPAKARLLGASFGKVRYWRTYLRQTNGHPGGLFPRDAALGLLADGSSMGLLGRAVQLATRMSFPEAKHSLDVIHVVEYFWEAGACLYRAGGHALRGWVEQQNNLRYSDKATTIIKALQSSRHQALLLRRLRNSSASIRS